MVTLIEALEALCKAVEDCVPHIDTALLAKALEPLAEAAE